MAAIETSGLTKHYGSVAAVSDLAWLDPQVQVAHGGDAAVVLRQPGRLDGSHHAVATP